MHVHHEADALTSSRLVSIQALLEEVLARQIQESQTDMTTNQQLLDLLGQTNAFTSRIATAVSDIAGDQQSLIDALATANAEIARLGGNQISDEVVAQAQTTLDNLNTVATALEATASAFPPAEPAAGDATGTADGGGTPAVPDATEAPGQEVPAEGVGSAGEGTPADAGSTPPAP